MIGKKIMAAAIGVAAALTLAAAPAPAASAAPPADTVSTVVTAPVGVDPPTPNRGTVLDGTTPSATAPTEGGGGCKVKVQDRLFQWSDRMPYIDAHIRRHDYDVAIKARGQDCNYKYARDKWKFKNIVGCWTAVDHPTQLWDGIGVDAFIGEADGSGSVNPREFVVGRPPSTDVAHCEKFDIPPYAERWQYIDNLIYMTVKIRNKVAGLPTWAENQINRMRVPANRADRRPFSGSIKKRVFVRHLDKVGGRHWAS